MRRRSSEQDKAGRGFKRKADVQRMKQSEGREMESRGRYGVVDTREV